MDSFEQLVETLKKIDFSAWRPLEGGYNYYKSPFDIYVRCEGFRSSAKAPQGEEFYSLGVEDLRTNEKFTYFSPTVRTLYEHLEAQLTGRKQSGPSVVSSESLLERLMGELNKE